MISVGISVEDRGGVRHVILDRPDKKNALTVAMYAALADAVVSAEADGVGALLMTARGDAFTAGNDLRDFLDRPPHGDDAPVIRFLHGLVRTDVPIVAAVRGPAVGIGTTMLLHCDLVYAAPTAAFTLPFVDLGIVPEAASSVLLPRRIGRARAAAALFLGRPIDAQAAFADGLVTEVVADAELDATAEAAARAIAAKPRQAVRETKRLLQYDREALLAAMAREGTAFTERLASDEARTAMSAFFARGARLNDLAGKTLFVTGASRGIGLAIALRAARDGANIVVAAKTVEPHPKLPGTIHTAAAEIEAAGGHALAVQCDVRSEDDVVRAVAAGADRFGGIDIVVNNASAIRLGGTAKVDAKAFDLMTAIGPRAVYLVTRAALPHLERGSNPHILTLSPPVALASKWVGAAPAYTFKKYGMSILTLAFAAEFRDRGIAANSLWPRTVIATAAVQNLLGGDAVMRASRTPAIVADAAYAILTADARTTTGNTYIDEDVLRARGVTDFGAYAVDPATPLQTDIFVD